MAIETTFVVRQDGKDREFKDACNVYIDRKNDVIVAFKNNKQVRVEKDRILHWNNLDDGEISGEWIKSFNSGGKLREEVAMMLQSLVWVIDAIDGGAYMEENFDVTSVEQSDDASTFTLEYAKSPKHEYLKKIIELGSTQTAKLTMDKETGLPKSAKVVQHLGSERETTLTVQSTEFTVPRDVFDIPKKVEQEVAKQKAAGHEE